MRQINTAQPLTTAAYEALRESVCTGDLAPGERLIQSELAERLGVSRLPVHEALQQLRQEGFATETGRRGLVVSPLDPAFLLQLFELRAALDRTAARSAARARRPRTNPAAWRSSSGGARGSPAATCSPLPARTTISMP